MSSSKENSRHTAIRLPMRQNKKGFITIYALLLLSVSFSICAAVTKVYKDKVKFIENVDEFRLINQIEVLVIGRIRQSYDDYKTKDETLYYHSCRISISYDNSSASISIICPKMSRHRVLTYDEIEGFVTDYY